MYPQPVSKPVSTVGPKILTFSGIAVLLAGGVALVFAVLALTGSLPLNVVTSNGQPGSGAVAGLVVSEEFVLDSPGGTAYDLWEVQPIPQGTFTLRQKDVSITGPDGRQVLVRSPDVDGSSATGGFMTQSFAAFPANQAGKYTVLITPGPGYSGPSSEIQASFSGPPPAPVDVVLTKGSEFTGFFTGILGFVGGMFAAILGLLLGGGMVVGGIIWWVAANKRKKAAAGFGPAF